MATARPAKPKLEKVDDAELLAELKRRPQLLDQLFGPYEAIIRKYSREQWERNDKAGLYDYARGT